jgi:hypothetical protein
MRNRLTNKTASDAFGVPSISKKASALVIASAKSSPKTGGEARELGEAGPYNRSKVKHIKTMLHNLSVSLGTINAAQKEITTLKGYEISPDGKLGGKGYVMTIRQLKDHLAEAVNNISDITDTLSDELTNPRWGLSEKTIQKVLDDKDKAEEEAEEAAEEVIDDESDIGDGPEEPTSEEGAPEEEPAAEEDPIEEDPAAEEPAAEDAETGDAEEPVVDETTTEENEENEEPSEEGGIPSETEEALSRLDDLASGKSEEDSEEETEESEESDEDKPKEDDSEDESDEEDDEESDEESEEEGTFKNASEERYANIIGHNSTMDKTASVLRKSILSNLVKKVK